jgi:hypothetical protein
LNTTYPLAVKPYRLFSLDPFNLNGYFDIKIDISSEPLLTRLASSDRKDRELESHAGFFFSENPSR